MLVDALGVEPFAVEPVLVLNMLGVPAAQKIKQRLQVTIAAALNAVQCLTDFVHQPLMLLAMNFQSRVTVALQQRFFAVEVHPCELNQPLELFNSLLARRAVQKLDAQLIDGIHQDAVLVIHRLHPDKIRVTPRQTVHGVAPKLYALFIVAQKVTMTLPCVGDVTFV